MRLKALREKRGISQLKLAMDLDMNQNSISRYETGAREADYKSLIKFADYFDVSIDYLLERTDNPKTNFERRTAAPADTYIAAARCRECRRNRYSGRPMVAPTGMVGT